MPKVSIIYFSQGGTTTSLAESVAQGIKAVDADAQLLCIESSQFAADRWQDDNILKQLSLWKKKSES